MKNLYLLTLSTALSLCLSVNESVSAQIVNGNFETQYPNTPPSQEVNIKQADASSSFQSPDQLPNWLIPANMNTTNLVNATFMATNGDPSVNPQGSNYFSSTTFLPHNNSTGCLGFKRHGYGDFTYDGMAMQRVNLLAGHSYQVTYWVLKLHESRYDCKMALSVVNSASPPKFNGTSSVNSLVPTPYSIIKSPYVSNTQSWQQVTGSFTAKSPASGESTWVVVGFDRALETTNNSSTGEFFNYGIDDVSLVDMGCAAVPSPVAIQYDQQNDDCLNVAHFAITNYDPSFTYTYNKGRGNPTIIRNGVSQFIVKVSGNQTSAGATFTITATSPTCGSTTSDEIEATYQCVGISYGRMASTTTAYPNPASESISLPEGMEGATLINDSGKVMRKANSSGKLDVQALPEGLYNLRMLKDGKTVNQRIQIKH